MNLIQLARDRMRRRNIEWLLDEGRWNYWLGDLDNAIRCLRNLDIEVIQEPPFDSEEYRNGERKSAIPEDEQEEEQKSTDSGFFGDDVYPERDENGYLIR